MQKYEVIIATSVFKYLGKLHATTAALLENKMLSLENNPRPPGYKKLKGRNAYRIRVGEYRIIYEIVDKQLLVKVIDTGHRKDIYK